MKISENSVKRRRGRSKTPRPLKDAAAVRKKFREEIYQMTTMNLLETAVRDLHFALRTIRNNPVFVSTAVLTLALAIGGNTAMFTIIRAVLLNPLEYRDPDRLVRLSGGATPARFQEMRANARSFTELGAFTPQQALTFSHGAQPEV